MKQLLTLLFALLSLSIEAQTARKFVLPLAPDSAAKLTCYLPATPTGRAIVGVPGGGYSVLSDKQEGHQWADWMNEQGIAYFVVSYRMPKGDRSLPVGDVSAAMLTVRDSATVWGIDPKNIGIMGSSAGGHLASVISTLTPPEVRPNFSILFYPVISMDEQLSHVGSCRNFLGKDQQDPEMVRRYSTHNAIVGGETPPAILITANDDKVVPPATNAIPYYTSMNQAGNDCTLLVYPTGGHGFGCATWFKYHDIMMEELRRWLDHLPAPQVQ